MAQDELRAPLVSQTIDEKHKTNEQNNFMVYLSTFVAVCGSFAFGTCAGYSSPIQSSITEDLNLSLSEYSLFGSILTFGAMIGAITSGPIADFIGRKGALRISSVFCSAGWLAIYLAEGPLGLDIGRLATGYGIGVFSYVVPVFIAEIAPKNLRGSLTAANQLMIVAAVSLSFVVGTVMSWRILALMGVFPCIVLVTGLFFIPESPRWLAKTGNQKEFRLALRKLRGKDADISEEADEIQDYIETLEKLPKAKLLDLFQRKYSRSVIVGVVLMLFHQFGGINGICFYTSIIFESAGFPADLGSIIYALLQIVITVLNMLFIDKAGRKPLLLVSATGMVLGCLTTALSFYLKTYEIGLSAVPALAVTGIMLYISSFSVGMGAIPWVIMSEVPIKRYTGTFSYLNAPTTMASIVCVCCIQIFPINIKGVAGSLATLVNWFGAWAISYTFNFLLSWSSYGTFILYAAINAGAIVFVIRMVPETKGRTLEQIQAAING